MTGSLADGEVRAVLFGTGAHAPGSRLAPLPSVDTTLDEVQRTLADICGMDPAQVTRVPADAGPAQVIAAVEETTGRAGGPVLVYYVGHGLLGPRDALYLATRASRGADRVAQAVPYRTLRDLLGEAPHGSLVVLDCCFSGRGTPPPSDGGARRPFATARPRGSFLLSSASHFALSFAPEGERHTLFTGRLLRLLREGDPAGPPWLTADSLHAALDRAFAEDPRVRPARHSEGMLGSLVLARNRAYPAAPAAAAGGAEPPADVPCPYPGLEPFRAEDSPYFFGRGDLSARLLDAATDDTDRGPVVLIGASGAGKSSLLRAGLLARLEARGPGGTPARTPALLLAAPGRNPMRTLARAWAAAAGLTPDEAAAGLGKGRFPDPRPGRPACRLLVVDQFEEVFTRCDDPGERAAFLDLLTGDGPGPRPKVVLGLRADHYGNCLAHPGLQRVLPRALTLSPMGEPELRAAIEEPAAAVGLTLEDGLTDRLLRDLTQGQDTDTAAALPFLAHALRETWRRRSGTRLTLAAYQATGGIWESVATTGRDLHGSLDKQGQRTLRTLLLLLVHLPPDGGTAVVRHRVPLSDLPDGTREIRDRLARHRLLTVDHDTVQIAHESLLRAWPTLRDWIREDAAGLLLRQRLRAAAAEWDDGGRRPEFLYRGSRLRAALELDELPAREKEFLDAGVRAADHERHREARRRKVLQRVALALALALCVTIASTVIALRQWQAADEAHELATQRALLAQAGAARTADPDHALDLALAAYALKPSADARQSLSETLSGPYRGSFSRRGGFFDTALSPDGRTLVSSSADELHLWDVGRIPAPDTPPVRLPCASDTLGRAALGGRDGHLLAAVCGGRVTLWDITGFHEGTAPRRLASPHVRDMPGRAGAVALDRDGTRLAAVGRRGEDATAGALTLWDLSGPRSPRRTSVTGDVTGTDAVTFAPDGRTLLTVSEETGAREARLWDVADPRRPEPGDRLPGSGPAAFSPDGRLVAVASWKDVGLIDVTSPDETEPVARWSATTSYVEGLAFTPDGTRLSTGHLDGTAAVWRLGDRGTPRREAGLAGHGRGPVDTLAFGPDGRSMVSVGRQEAVRWEFASARVAAAIPGDSDTMDIELAPDGSTLAFVRRGRIELWDLSDRAAPRRTATLPARGGGTSDLALSADGTLLACAYADAVELWDVTDPGRARLAGKLRGAPDDDLGPSLAFAPDAPHLAVLGDGLRLWDVSRPADPSVVSEVAGHSALGDLAFSPDGRRLVVPERDGGVSLWEAGAGHDGLVPLSRDALADVRSSEVFSADGHIAVTGTQLWDVRGRDGPELLGTIDGRAQAIHPDGTLVATAPGVWGSTVTLWSVTEPARAHVAGTLPHPGSVWDVVFAPDGRTVLTTSEGSVRLWDLGDGPAIAADPLGMACRVADGGFAPFEWRVHLPGVPFRRSCPATPSQSRDDDAAHGTG
ncbi:caspase family protein [Streptomyces albus]|uniref:caspase, EACC1-associated type n=1 Tax=Streptomyces albus TaxID=1888 RepID=UPI0004C7FDE8|nr:caspase family protein [Streptomyces albus]